MQPAVDRVGARFTDGGQEPAVVLAPALGAWPMSRRERGGVVEEEEPGVASRRHRATGSVAAAELQATRDPSLHLPLPADPSLPVPIVEPRIESCFHQMRWRAAGGLGPVVAPQTTTRAPGAATWSEVAQVASPTVSTTTSMPLPPVAVCTASFTSPVAWFTVASAPSSRARSSLVSLDEVTSTFAPSAFPMASAAVETPPPMPQASTHSPSRRPARVTSIR